MTPRMTVRCSGSIFLTFVLIGTLAANQANAATIVGIYIDPPSTAGAGATSTRSGPGSFHIYAADDNAGTFGIATYSVTMGPAVTASNNRTPATTFTDSNGDGQSAGFTLLRSSSSANPMTGAENLPGQTPFLIKGFGQTVGSFTNICAVAGSACVQVIGPSTSPFWGGPYVGGTLVDWNSSTGTGTKKWLFLGEGTYSPALYVTRASIVPSATFTVYSSSSANDFSQIASITNLEIVPEPATFTMAALSLFGLLGLARGRRSFPNIM